MVAMRLVCSKTSLPRQFINHPKAKGLVFEKDLRIGSSRLRAKLLIFKNRTVLNGFWRDVLGKGNLGRYCFGAVNGLYTEIQNVTAIGKTSLRRLEADRRYFCVIGMIEGFFNAEIVTHEAIHASYCYCKRAVRSPWDRHAKDFDEEAIAYPAGEIANAINNVYWKRKRCRPS